MRKSIFFNPSLNFNILNFLSNLNKLILKKHLFFNIYNFMLNKKYIKNNTFYTYLINNYIYIDK